MIVTPRIKGFVCTTAHPVGCKAHVLEEIKYVDDSKKINGPKNVLIIGASTGYGLASRIVSMAGLNASTIGVFYEKEASDKRTASAGWYNSVAFEEEASKRGIYAKSINGDAFSNEIKNETIDLIKKDLGKIDLVIYSLASPRRIDPVTGEKYNSVLKPVGKVYSNKSLDLMTGVISNVSIEPASEEEVEHTVKVMGGEDWELWIDALLEADVLNSGCLTLSYSYIGPDVTKDIYREGTIGLAKEHLEKSAFSITEKLKKVNGAGYVVIAKALVTQASAAIPIVPLYIAALYKVMKEEGSHEGCIEQIYRLFQHVFKEDYLLDSKGRIRIDDLEMKAHVQKKAIELFESVSTENIGAVLDLESYQKEFYRLFGFAYDNVDYNEDIEIQLNIPSLTI